MTTADDLEAELFARFARLPYPVFRCCVAALLMQLGDLYQEQIPDDLRHLCTDTVREAERILTRNEPRDRMRELADEWDALARDGFGVIDDGLNDALLTHVTAACELGELPDVPRYAALNNGTRALLRYPGWGAPMHDGVEGGLAPSVPLDSAAGEALRTASRIMDAAERWHALGLPCDPRAVYHEGRAARLPES